MLPSILFWCYQTATGAEQRACSGLRDGVGEAMRPEKGAAQPLTGTRGTAGDEKQAPKVISLPACVDPALVGFFIAERAQ